MKGRIIIAKVDGIFDRFAPDSIKRIVVTLKDNKVLAITDYLEMCAVIGYNDKEDKFVKEVEVPDDLVEKALALVKAQEELNKTKKVFNTLLNNK